VDPVARRDDTGRSWKPNLLDSTKRVLLAQTVEINDKRTGELDTSVALSALPARAILCARPIASTAPRIDTNVEVLPSDVLLTESLSDVCKLTGLMKGRSTGREPSDFHDVV
jgi:hypothetical protein